MENETQPAGSFWFGVWLILIGGAFLYYAGQIQTLRLADENDPGPKSFPVVLSLVLLVGGAHQTLLGCMTRRPPRPRKPAKPDSGSPWSLAWKLTVVSLSLFCAVVIAVGAPLLAIASWPWSVLTGVVLLACVGLWCVPAGRSNHVALLVAGLTLLLLTVPLVGFYVPTFAFAALMTLRLGGGWWSALLTSGVILLIIRLLFVEAFRVQLPQGALGALV